MKAPKIEKNIPVPSLPGSGGTVFSKITEKMEVGDSVLWPGESSTRVSNRLTFYRIRLGRKFVVRAVDGGARVWRLA